MDSYQTPLGELRIGWMGHASLIMEWAGKVIYADPYSEVADYLGKPKADLILITHNHYDHYDPAALAPIQTPQTRFVVSQNVGLVDERYIVLENGAETQWEGLHIQAVASYNINRRNEEGQHFHPKGVGNGYVLDFSGFKVYVPGDTEPISEMDQLPHLDVAFLPKNLPYTMTDDEFVALANRFQPDVLYPIHFFELDYDRLRKAVDPKIILKNPEKYD